MKEFHLHLVSDATGETLHSVARACFVQFDGIEPVEHHWPLVRTKGQIEKIVRDIEKHQGIVLFTIVKEELRTALEIGCSRLHVPCISVLDPVIHALTAFLGLESSGKSGRQHTLDADYFDRMDAMTYTLNHDDGQSTHDLGNADIVLVGVSRTSKTPTCIYLANRGIKAANYPLVPDIGVSVELDSVKKPTVVALITSAHTLVEIRKKRSLELGLKNRETDYTNIHKVEEEIVLAKRIFANKGWPVIDITRRSVEETASAIMNIISIKGKN